MGTQHRIFFVLLAATAIGLGGCKKLLNKNQDDPNGLGIVQLGGKDVFAQALNSTVTDNLGLNISTATDNYDYATQWMGYLARTTSFAPSGAQEQMETFGLTNSFSDGNWASLYHNIYDYNFVIGNSAPNSILPGASRVMRTMLFQDLVDQFGNIPYAQAAQPNVSITPAYDSAAVIYKDLVVQLDSAIAEIQASQSTTDDASDIMFKGSKPLWLEFANTIKLRILLRQVPNGDQAYVSSEISAMMQQGNGFLGAGQDAAVQPGYSDATSQTQSPFWGAYGFLPNGGGSTQNNNFFIANSLMVNFLTTTADPRLGYFYAKNPAGGYGGNFFGSSLTPSAQLSPIGPGILQSPSMPALLFSASQSFFMQAEAVQRGLMTGNYQTLFQQGVEESFRYLGVPNATAAADAFISGSGSDFVNINTSANPLQTILYQKWVAECELDGLEAYCDYRRTGYPVIGQVSAAAPGQPMPKRILYPQTEYTQNTVNVNAQNQQPSDLNKKIFWAQ
ncbi:MAG TPA: SusD/RagB family nutrient-binding outer membrane lipoprotein [Puia sp.]|nr:SusD/RagB family nutrient-binding outer membrane lipoprotein [Puia sp.]